MSLYFRDFVKKKYTIMCKTDLSWLGILSTSY